MNLPDALRRRDTPAAVLSIAFLLVVVAAGLQLWNTPRCGSICRAAVVGGILVAGAIASMLVWHRLWNEFAGTA